VHKLADLADGEACLVEKVKKLDVFPLRRGWFEPTSKREVVKERSEVDL
jgi:hypothetical protein